MSSLDLKHILFGKITHFLTPRVGRTLFSPVARKLTGPYAYSFTLWNVSSPGWSVCRVRHSCASSWSLLQTAVIFPWFFSFFSPASDGVPVWRLNLPVKPGLCTETMVSCPSFYCIIKLQKEHMVCIGFWCCEGLALRQRLFYRVCSIYQVSSVTKNHPLAVYTPGSLSERDRRSAAVTHTVNFASPRNLQLCSGDRLISRLGSMRLYFVGGN